MSADRLNLPPPTVVADQRGLERLLADLEDKAEIAVDTEADSFFNYQEKVCLIQVTVEDRDYVVDPLAKVDVSALADVFADPQRTKVFHDGEYDVLILKRSYGFRFGGLFDTRIAAAALGEANPGLASVLRRSFGVELDKSLQRSNWSQRPLTREQLAYARLDTHFLIDLMHRQRVELHERDRMVIVEGECRRLEALEPAERRFDPNDFIRIKGARKLTAKQRQRLREVFVLREELARSSDLPPFKVLPNRALLAVAAHGPRSLRELTSLPDFSPRLAKRHGEAVLRALDRAEKKGALERLPPPAGRDGEEVLEDEELELHERLKEWRKQRAEREGLDSSLVLNRRVLLRLATAQPRTQDELAAIEGLLEWQERMFGAEILDVVERFRRDAASGKLSLGSRRSRRREPRD